MRHTVVQTAPAFVLTLLCAAALTACGGGGSSEPTTDTPTSTDTATAYAANATLVSSDAGAALDASVAAAQAVVSAQAVALAAGTDAGVLSVSAAESARPAAVANVPVACPGGGSATLSITGGSAASVLNGKLDAGEVYMLVYAGCRGEAGAAAIDGTLQMTVLSASAAELSLALVATELAVALPAGGVTLAGSATEQLGSSALNSGATQLTSHLTAPALTLVTRFNARSSSFTLSAVDTTRQGVWLNGVLQSSTVSGTHTLAATLPNGAFSYTVSTQGGASYSAAGVPTAGAWTVTLPRTAVGVSIANASATITIDEGKDGTIDRTFTVPVATLQSSAG